MIDLDIIQEVHVSIGHLSTLSENIKLNFTRCETSQKYSSVSKDSTNIFYIFRQCTYIM